jgi:geranylgeranyl transferase type-1 subunit beta
MYLMQQQQSYDYGIGQGPGQESHGGSTYCAVAALHLMGRLDDLPNKKGAFLASPLQY